MELRFESRKRYVVEGEWSGYRSDQQRVVHREVVKGSRKRFLKWVGETYSIRYTDGTCLYLSVREAKPREKVQQVKGYTSLIEDCFFHRVASVDALETARKAWQEFVRAARAGEGKAIDHIDGDPTNNDLANLRVVTIKERSRGDERAERIDF